MLDTSHDPVPHTLCPARGDLNHPAWPSLPPASLRILVTGARRPARRGRGVTLVQREDCCSEIASTQVALAQLVTRCRRRSTSRISVRYRTGKGCCRSSRHPATPGLLSDAHDETSALFERSFVFCVTLYTLYAGRDKEGRCPIK